MRSEIRVAVVGAGSMGSNHIRVTQQTRGARLAAVVDPDLERARASVLSPSVEVVSSVDALPEEIDAAIVAVPTTAHLQVAKELVRRGIHLLVEKPLAMSPSEAEDLVAAAHSAGVVLSVGHVERFNPAVFELPRFVDDLIHLEATRVSPYTARVGDGVIADLMIHDIDIACALIPSRVVDVSGVTRAVKGPTEDIASVNMAFESGEVATFNASRLGQGKIRRIELTQTNCTVSADLLRQDITITRMSQNEYISDDGHSLLRQVSVVETPFLETRGEPLVRQMEHFLYCIRGGHRPLVDGEAGVRAVVLAKRAADAVHMASARRRL